MKLPSLKPEGAHVFMAPGPLITIAPVREMVGYALEAGFGFDSRNHTLFERFLSMDQIERPWTKNLTLATGQFKMAANHEFQFWDNERTPAQAGFGIGPRFDLDLDDDSRGFPTPDDDSRTRWWFQKEEPLVPAGWKTVTEWKVDGPSLRSRLLAKKLQESS